MIHTDICGSFRIPSVDAYNSFITLIDDFSHYRYIFSIHEQSKSLVKFKIFKAKVENQHNLKIKVLRSDQGGEYYDRHTPYGQIFVPFELYLQENGIVAQYSMLGEPKKME